MSYFESNRISVYPTAYRQYVNESNETVEVNPEARVNTEYNTTNLIGGLINKEINNGNFVVDYDDTNKFIKFCMQGYYFNLDLSSLNITDLYVKINVINTVSSTDWKYVYELVPINYSNSNRDLDYKDTSDNKVKFIGLDYVTSNPTSDYFALLVSGGVPAESKLKFSIQDIGYLSDGTWYPISTKFTTGELTASKVNGLILSKNANGFSIEGGTTSKKLVVEAYTYISSTFRNNGMFQNYGTVSNTGTIGNSGTINIGNQCVFTNNATTTINKNFTVGATSTYTGGVEIKSKNNLSIVGENTGDSTLTFNGTSIFQSGNYESSLTGGSETITLGGNTFNVVTRDTTQSISGSKTFTSPVTITSTTQDEQSLKLGGSIVACKENDTYKVLLGNFDTNYYGIKFDTNKYIAYKNDTSVMEFKNGNGVVTLGSTNSDATTTQNGTVRVTGGISATKKCYFDGLLLTDAYITLNSHVLTLGGNLTTGVYSGTQKNVIIQTKDGKDFTLVGGGTVIFNDACTFDGGSYSLDNTSGSESVTIAGKTLNVVTRDTVQTITSNKAFSGTVFFGSQGSTYNISNTGVANLKDLYVRSGGIYVYNSGSARQFYVSSTGNVYANQFNGNYYSSSDIRLKENIVPFENKKSILDLPIKRFDYINGKKNNIGCIAQDLQKLYPELVTTNEDGYLSIEETKLVYLLIDEVKKLKEEVDKLKK